MTYESIRYIEDVWVALMEVGLDDLARELKQHKKDGTVSPVTMRLILDKAALREHSEVFTAFIAVARKYLEQKAELIDLHRAARKVAGV